VERQRADLGAWPVAAENEYNPGMLDRKRLRRCLPVGGLGLPLHLYRTIGSTNDRAAELAAQGAPQGTLVVADEQTAGRGRAGRRWITPPGSALAFSLVLRPQASGPSAIGPLNALGALAVVDALAEVGVSAQVKWPNDVVLGGRKACGVLVEASWLDGSLQAVVLGIGLNVATASVPPLPALDYPATCVQAALKANVDRVDLLLGLLAAIAAWLPRLKSPELVDAWQARLAFMHQDVILIGPEGQVRGELLGLAPDGRARIRSTAGETLLMGGEGISLRPVDMPE